MKNPSYRGNYYKTKVCPKCETKGKMRLLYSEGVRKVFVCDNCEKVTIK